MQITPIKTRIFKENEDLLKFILEYINKIPKKNLENSVLVVTSKIGALSEGRIAEYKNELEKIKLIKKESSFALKTKYTWLTIKDGIVIANAGIDESNVSSKPGKVILLPKNSFKSAGILRKKLMKKFHLKKFGVLITDSRLMPLRAGVVGIALGYVGFAGIKSYIGKKDIFGRTFRISKVDIADSLATSAVLCMGEGREQQPLALVTNAPIVFTSKINKKELVINPKEDIYAPLFAKLKNKI
jgi:F420-0:gamma-glutamyl ligase